MNLLLTGGTGYIGSHAALALAGAGHRVVLYDNLTNSHRNTVERIESLLQRPAGITPPSDALTFVEGDIRDTALLTQTLLDNGIDAVIHLAGLKSVCESVEKPLDYYDNNVGGTISLLQAMQTANVGNLVFSSSANVYGEPQYLPIDESHPTSPGNPYGRSKLQIETILADVVRNSPAWNIVCLRYFNPVGAHESGLLGEMPTGIPNNLMPYITLVAAGELPYLRVFGNDYDTPDGTGLRDYIHVMDLAEGHLAALEYLGTQEPGIATFNLGTGRGHTVLQMIRAFEETTGQAVPYKISPRREQDVAASYAKVDLAADLLRWQASRTLQEMCASTWKFRSMNAAGNRAGNQERRRT